MPGFASKTWSGIVVLVVYHTCGSVSLSLFLSRSLLELHLAEMQHGRRTSVHTHLLRVLEAEHNERLLPQQPQFIAFMSTIFQQTTLSLPT